MQQRNSSNLHLGDENNKESHSATASSQLGPRIRNQQSQALYFFYRKATKCVHKSNSDCPLYPLWTIQSLDIQSKETKSKLFIFTCYRNDEWVIEVASSPSFTLASLICDQHPSIHSGYIHPSPADQSGSTEHNAHNAHIFFSASELFTSIQSIWSAHDNGPTIPHILDNRDWIEYSYEPAKITCYSGTLKQITPVTNDKVIWCIINRLDSTDYTHVHRKRLPKTILLGTFLDMNKI